MDFYFTAKAPNGKTVKGKISANSALQVKQMLKSKGYRPISVKSSSLKKSALSKGKVNPKEFQIFLRQLSVLLSSGVRLLESLEALRESSFSKTFDAILDSLIKDISEGRSLSEAMGKHPKTFQPMVVNLIRAGEEGGILDSILDRLSIYYEKRRKLKSKVIGALIYPIITVIVAVLALVAILTFVIPKFSELFESQGLELPQMTQFVINLSNFFAEYWYAFIGVFFGGPILLVYLHRSGIGRRALDAFFLKVPLFGALIKKSAVARMSRTLSTLLTSGIRVNEAIDITIGTMGNVLIDEYMMVAKNEIIAGKPLSEPLSHSNFFPKIVVQMVSIGEKTGQLDDMLSKVADFYEEEVEAAASHLTSMLEPLIIVVLGGLVGFLVISMFLPIFNLGNAVL